LNSREGQLDGDLSPARSGAQPQDEEVGPPAVHREVLQDGAHDVRASSDFYCTPRKCHWQRRAIGVSKRLAPPAANGLIG
ncbi:MAG TPA: hypothetical protein VNN80_10835, partial [Polyangiaceae bacterium]|nr:hypothetical protein [Polyangiaceae bacterium]